MGGVFWSIAAQRFLYNKYTMLAAVVLSISATCWVLMTPTNQPPYLRRPLLDLVARRITEQMPPQLALQPIAVAQFGGDLDGSISEGIRKRIAATKGRAISNEFLERVLRQIGMQGQAVTNLDQALRVARETGVSGVLFGDVTETRAEHGKGFLKLDLRWADRGSGQAIFAGVIEAEVGGPFWTISFWKLHAFYAPVTPRILAWLAFTLLLPVVGSPLIRRLTARESNAVNLAVLAFSTLIDGLIALGLLGFGVWSPISGLLLVVAVVGAAYYNFVAIAWVDEYLG